MSKFCDQTVVEFIGGNGGDGAVHFRREKFIPRGGPDGGDGGHGGNIILIADENLNTLFEFNTTKLYKAEDGSNGQKSLMSGKTGLDLELKIPVGTLVLDDKDGSLLFDLKKNGQRYVVARGGKGGFGNAHFKSSVHRAPMFAEKGEEGENKRIRLELQLVADVGIIGFPSAGKSTLISVISNARPKIADYPFTTLIPNLGVVSLTKYDKRMKDSFVVADIPGLIEGAHLGKGLGHEFLRHVSRTEVLVHLVDPTRLCPEDYLIINEELEKYDKRLSSKEQIVCISKTDAVSADDLAEFKKNLISLDRNLKKSLYEISSVSGKGVKELVFEMFKRVKAFREQRRMDFAENEAIIRANEEKVFRPHLEKKKFSVTFRRSKLEAESGKMRKIFDVTGERIEQVIKMTDLENEEGLERIYHFMTKMGIKNELKALGARPGDRIRIAGRTFLMR
jgi:GTP-binding protein